MYTHILLLFNAVKRKTELRKKNHAFLPLNVYTTFSISYSNTFLLFSQWTTMYTLCSNIITCGRYYVRSEQLGIKSIFIFFSPRKYWKTKNVNPVNFSNTNDTMASYALRKNISFPQCYINTTIDCLFSSTACLDIIISTHVCVL